MWTSLLPDNAYSPEAINIFCPLAQWPSMANKVDTIRTATLKMAKKVEILQKKRGKQRLWKWFVVVAGVADLNNTDSLPSVYDLFDWKLIHLCLIIEVDFLCTNSVKFDKFSGLARIRGLTLYQVGYQIFKLNKWQDHYYWNLSGVCKEGNLLGRGKWNLWRLS